jgi:type IV secretory pathway component VirB8
MSILNKSKPKDDLPNTVRDAEEKGKVIPESFHISSLRERRLLIALRSVSISLIVAIMLNVILSLVIFSLVPLKEVRPFLVRIADENSVVATIRPIQDTFEAIDILTEQLVREYVLNRHEILRSNDVMAERWSEGGYVRMTSSPAEYRRFITNVSTLLEDIRREDGIAQATILSVVPITEGKSYVVDFRLTTRDRADNIVQDVLYTSTMEISFLPLTGLTRDQMLINPTGFTVTSYSIAEKTQ